MKKTAFLIKIILVCFPVFGQEAYNEIYRPQYHFTAKEGWIGDPCGLTKYEGLYHFFWWGHAVSEDLVHWEEKAWPMQGGNGFSYFTGSIVVDKENTSGFSKRDIVPMVAVYTSAWPSGLQNQGISYSIDYENFYYYAGNPVLDIGSNSFRDPDVIWYEPTKRWIMSITASDDKKVDFYASSDLKSWEYLSSFGPVAARQEIWEVPSLIQLPVDGNFNEKKWVLIVGMGPNKVQYYVGDFNGREFIPCAEYSDFLHNGKGTEGSVFASFEEDNYGSWRPEGSAFNDAPISGGLPDQMEVSGYIGNKLVNTFLNGDGTTGKLISSSFVIEKNNINFLIGGGNDLDKLCIRLVVEGNIVRRSTGDNSERLKWRGWNVSDLKGKEAVLEIVDEVTGDWGHILVDQVMFSDVLMNHGLEHTLWGDYGPDFYAVRPYRDYDEEDSAPLWQAWMSNWEYAGDVPTSPWKGLQSIPREIELKRTSKGYQLYQQPFEGFKKLRKEVVETANYTINATQEFEIFKPSRNVYEAEFVFDRSENPEQSFGINLCVRRDSKLTLRYDAATSNVFFDRTNVGNVTFNENFPKTLSIPVPSTHDKIKFRIFMDQSSVEIFINDGESVISSLIFPHPNATAIEVFSLSGETRLSEFRGWELNSIWENNDTHITDNENKNISIFSDKNGCIFIQPNGTEIQHISIYDLAGQAVFAQANCWDSESIKLETSLPDGCYIVRIKGDEHITCKKIVIAGC